MATGPMAITSTSQAQDVQDMETSVITANLVMIDYVLFLSRKPSTKLRESFAWFAPLCVVLNGAGLPAMMAPDFGLFCFIQEFGKAGAEGPCLMAMHCF